jgi:bifunctional UDP-N-acetylglucosamine pyrophosphorylase/glucosamine-1-phosphate N-acetyltransferase
MTNKNTHSIILAAGKGSRMHSQKSKVLHTIADKSLLQFVIDTSQKISAKCHIVYGFQGETVKKTINNNDINWVEQQQQNGTGHAVAQVMPFIKDDDTNVVILYGDVPLITEQTLTDLIAQSTSGLSLLTVTLDNPQGYGRIVRDSKNDILAIIEQKDATNEQLKITEVNTGIMVVKANLLKKYLAKLDSNNAQGELYLTDIIAMAVADNINIGFVNCLDKFEVAGVNNKQQLVELERVYQEQQSHQLLMQGLELKDPKRFDLRGKITFGMDCICDINVLIQGEVTLGNNVQIAPNCIIKNSTIGDNTQIHANSIIENATIKNNVNIGPFARIRPDTILENNTKIGNFVEVKKSILGEGSKASHLSYIGDSIIGKEVNIGAGVITCNYDGVNKHQTTIGDDAFIGSDTQLVAPVTIGKNATIGAGSTITKDTEDEKLTLTRSKQITLNSWQRPNKK